MLLKNEKNDFENDYVHFYLNDFNELEKRSILKYLNIERIGMDISPSKDFSYRRKENGKITLIKAKCYRLDGFKEYTIVLKNDHLIGGFDSGKVYLIDDENFIYINDKDLERYRGFGYNNKVFEHYRIQDDSIKLFRHFELKDDLISLRSYDDKHISINGKLYYFTDKYRTCFTTPEYDEIISLDDYDDKSSIIFDETICPRELRFALQKIVREGQVALGIKQAIADESLIKSECEEYMRTIVIQVIINGYKHDCFYYDPLINKIVSFKPKDGYYILPPVKERLNSITRIINDESLKNTLYVDAIKEISSVLPEENRKKIS